ncbi:MAG: hypothetical protein ACJA1I_000520 [Zhongshania marina]
MSGAWDDLIDRSFNKLVREGRVIISVDPAGKDAGCTVKATVVDGVITVDEVSHEVTKRSSKVY